MLDFAQIRAMLEPSGEPAPQPPLNAIRSIGHLVNLASRCTPLPTNCLTRSLVLAWLLRRRGISFELRIGVRLSGGVLGAHAWVECEGVPVNDRDDIADDFSVFEQLPGALAFDTP